MNPETATSQANTIEVASGPPNRISTDTKGASSVKIQGKNNDKKGKTTASRHKSADEKAVNSHSTRTDLKSSRTNSSNQEKAKVVPDDVLGDFSQATRKIKEEIKTALDKQSNRPLVDLSKQVDRLRGDLIELSSAENIDNNYEANQISSIPTEPSDKADEHQLSEPPLTSNVSLVDDESSQNSRESDVAGAIVRSDETSTDSTDIAVLSRKSKTEELDIGQSVKLDNMNKENSATRTEFSNTDQVYKDIMSNDFALLNARLDSDSKLAVLSSSLKKNADPNLLKPICKKLIELNEQNNYLSTKCQTYKFENEKLITIRQKLSALCRELQKSNNSVRIESLNLIREERDRAKDQTSKIQSTLSSVIKLFDENQQRNSTLREENAELQTKLRSLIEHCDNWEKSIEAVLKQRDIESRLLKTELAKANLSANVEREKSLTEKQELMKMLAMMSEQQRKIEAQEARLKSDLSNYASKYDECQTIISKGMGKFQTESNRMLKQLEQSKKDYLTLLAKYENSNKKIKQLLEEKLRWDKTIKAANKKVETLEKLCRALRAGQEVGDDIKNNSAEVNITGNNKDIS